MKLLGLDFETTWTDPVDVGQLRITEIGAVLMDWETRKPLEIFSKLLWEESYPASPPELVELTGITDDMLIERAWKPHDALSLLMDLILEADYIVAHNGTLFDKPLLENECLRNDVSLFKKPWIDTRTDIPFPKHIKARSLSHLAGEHDFVNPFKHRALFDVLTMLKILGQYDINQVIKLASEPLVHAVARVTFQEKQKAKDHGYYWDPEKKIWFRPMKESQLEAEREKVPFVIEVVYLQGE